MSVGRCHLCVLKAGIMCGGVCPCPVDRRDIVRHVAANYCPAGYFGTTEKPEGFDDEPQTEPESVVVAVPRDQWPTLIRIIAASRKEGEAGAGDTAKRVLHHLGADALAWLYEKATGRECGCADRQAKLNRLYPY